MNITGYNKTVFFVCRNIYNSDMTCEIYLDSLDMVCFYSSILNCAFKIYFHIMTKEINKNIKTTKVKFYWSFDVS